MKILTFLSPLMKKLKKKIWSKIVSLLKNNKIYFKIYRCYWHQLFYRNKKLKKQNNFFTAVPNEGAGIGHQLANWIAGFWFAQQFNLTFAHWPFSLEKWETFLGFGANEPKVADLLKNGYKSKRLPLFDETKPEEVKRIKNIIQSYSGKKTVFICEQDQFYRDQYGVIDDIKKKFFSAPARKNETLIYDAKNYNIAIHVRRGDIMNDTRNPNLQMRYIPNDYFRKVLEQVIQKIKTDKPMHIYLFSQGKLNDYIEFATFENMHWCLEMDAQDSFLHMVYSDCLITSKSSFSYKAALLNTGIKVCPENFWHGYPSSKNWIIANQDGIIDK